MARGKKSSLDMEEPVVVQEDEFESVPIVEEPIAEPTVEPVVKAEEKPAVVEEKKKESVNQKAETQNKTVERKAKRGVKICVI